MPDLLPNASRAKDYQPEKWNQRHRLVVSLWASGFRNKEIAETLGYTPNRVSQILNDPRTEIELKELTRNFSNNIQDVYTRLQFHSNAALDEIVDEMENCTDPRIRQRAAFGILDRAGYSPIQKQITARTSPVSGEVIERMRAALDDLSGNEIPIYSNPTPEFEEMGSDEDTLDGPTGSAGLDISRLLGDGGSQSVSDDTSGESS